MSNWLLCNESVHPVLNVMTDVKNLQKGQKVEFFIFFIPFVDNFGLIDTKYKTYFSITTRVENVAPTPAFV